MSTEALVASPYERIGGNAAVRRLVDAFYDVMDHEPAYAALRAMHAEDLAPTRESLVGFMTVWLGGPRDWIEKRGGFCIMSRHRGMKVNPETAGQWMAAMMHAITSTGVDPDLAGKMERALAPMAKAMAGS